MPNNHGDHKLLISDSAQSIEGTPGAPFTQLDQRKSKHGLVISYPVKYGMGILIHFYNSTGAPFTFENG